MLKNKKYALGTWEMHLWTNEEKDFIFKKMLFQDNVCDYVDTAIDYNNDYLLNNLNPNAKIISKISSYHGSNYDFFVSNHLKCLNRNYIDIMLIHSNRGDWKSVALKMQNDSRFIEIGVSNFTADDIKVYKELTGCYPKYNELEINPFYTDVNTIDFCKDHGIKIISYGIFGGKYNSPTYIADFSIPYLLEYASTYADIIILKPESFRHVYELRDIICNYVSIDENRSYAPINKEAVSDNKSIEPMRYFPKDIKKYCHGFETYTNWCGKNTSESKEINIEVLFESGFGNKNENKINVPSFEMLGDYMTFLRYTFRQNYNDNSNVYDYDILIGDDGCRYIVYLYDENDRISKINKFDKVKVIRQIR